MTANDPKLYVFRREVDLNLAYSISNKNFTFLPNFPKKVPIFG